jgi:hypothetical protein
VPKPEEQAKFETYDFDYELDYASLMEKGDFDFLNKLAPQEDSEVLRQDPVEEFFGAD